MELYLDARVYDKPMICVVEIMGRHAGWLAASAAAATYTGFGPDLIYLPETDFDVDEFINDVREVYEDNGKVFIAVSEGIHDKSGKLISEYGSENATVDCFGHKQLGGLAATLVSILREHSFHFFLLSSRSLRSRAPTPYTRYRISPLSIMMNTVEAQRLPVALRLNMRFTALPTRWSGSVAKPTRTATISARLN